MLFSIRGKVIQIEQKFLVVEANSIGYEILVSNSEKYKLNEEVFLYLHHEIKEDNEYLVGFNDLPEKIVLDDFCYLTKSQILLYERILKESMENISKSDFKAFHGFLKYILQVL